jgi:hypothetical protein
MKKISSKGTFYYKRIFPVIGFGFLCIFIVISFIGGTFDKGPKLPLLIIPLLHRQLNIATDDRRLQEIRALHRFNGHV